ncbi:hypothetical protein PVAP13_5NG496800 [Panicum virgatum]|uniref:Uncharacterized protein n=1 Tax=Panicum virgatum TaxID=38727 RepID=A0A8T0RYF0_PANVG|nr:hypothetical protein PVAP13_5NG496800 [Panicum virgatum]
MGLDQDHWDDALPLQVRRADPPPRNASGDRVVALARTPARRPRLPSDLDVFVDPRLRAFVALPVCVPRKFQRYYAYFKRRKSPVKGSGQTALF